MSKIIKYSDNKFKTIYLTYNFTLSIKEEEIAKNVISCFALSKSSKKYKTNKEMVKYLSGLYGSDFGFSVDKYGDLFNFEFRILCINKKFLPNGEDVLKKCIKFLEEVIYNPNIKDGKFDEKVFSVEKNRIISDIEKRKDEKLKYAVSRIEELMSGGSPASSYLYGNVEDAKNVTNEEAVITYQNMLKNSLKTIIVTGNLEGYDNIEKELSDIFDKHEDSNVDEGILEKSNLENRFENGVEEVFEKMDTTQSVICLGLKNFKEKDNDFIVANVYNAVLGTTPSSKLFQNVREKASLAYTARSRYYRFKKNTIIYAGIEDKNYEKAKEIILKQVDDMKTGNITMEELNTAKASIISDIKEYPDSKIAMANWEFLNYLSKRNIVLDDMEEMVNNITIEDVVRYAKDVEVKKIYFLGGGKNV